MPICPKCGHTSSELGGKCPYDEYYFVHEQAANDARRDPMLGRIIVDKYIIVALINEGGMGAVYRALQTPLQREVALKVLRAELRESEQGGGRFAQEARAVARLHHPNIISLHDFGFDEFKHPYMVMEYAPGLSLTKWLKTQDLTLERVLHVTRQILSALQHAHENAIIHRDLKPENMIIVKSGTDPDVVKLLDFGIARVINTEATQHLTREGEVFGTPHYMAPEQARGDKNIGPPADIYAVGIMLFEMLTGRQPFDAPTPLAVLFQHLNEPLPVVEPRPGITVPDELVVVLKKATAKEVQDRYQAASEFLKALEQAVPSGNMQALLNVVVQSSVNPNTLIPGSSPIPTQQFAGRMPVMTPHAGGVQIYDPDASIEQRLPPDFHVSSGSDIDQGQSSKKTALLLGAMAATLAVLVGIVLYALNTKGNGENPDPAAEVVVDGNTNAKAPTEVVANTDTPEQPVQVEKKPAEPVVPEVAATDEQAPDAQNVAEKTVADEPTKEAQPVATTTVKPVQAQSTSGKVVRRGGDQKNLSPAQTTITPAKTEPVADTKTETKTETETKPQPVKFVPKDPRKW